jgi:arylsulfatase A-like enzyme
VDIAPTLAAMLDVPPPSASEGKPLPLKAPGS